MKVREWIIIALILCFAVIAYFPSIRGGFISDEYLLILNNPKVQHPEGFRSFLPDKFWTGKSKGIYYRPLIILSYALNWRLSQRSSLSYHVLNLLFYLGVVVLFFLLARKWMPHAAIAATAIFALHPIHTESVAWIPGRTDTISVFFVMLAWLLWTKAYEAQGTRRMAIHLASAFCVLLSLWAKEVAIVAPALFFLSDWWQKSGKKSLGKILTERIAGYALIAVVIAGYLLLRHQALSLPGPESAPAFLAGVPFWKKPIIISRIWTEYLRMMIYPYPLRIDEYYSQKLAPAAYPFWLCAISGIFWALALLAIVMGLIRRNSFAMLSLFWMVSLLPVSHIISFPTSLAERFAFLPSVFFALAFSLLVFGAGLQSRKFAKSIAAATCAFFFILTFFSTREYKDRYVYLRNAVSEVPGAAVLHNQLGLAGLDRGWLDSGEREFNWALLLSPDYPEATMNLALLKLKQGDSSAAVSLLQKAVSISPDYGDAYFNLGLVLKRLGRTEEAAAAFEKAHQLEPENPNAAFELAEIKFNKGDEEGAKKLADSALQTSPWHLPSVKLRIRIALSEKDYALARELISKAGNIAPNDPELERFKSALP